MHWRDQIADGVVPLRDIIDLEATFAKLKGNPLIDNNSLDGMAYEIPDDDLEDEQKMMKSGTRKRMKSTMKAAIATRTLPVMPIMTMT